MRIFNDPSSYYRFRMFWRLPYYVLGLVYSGVFLNFRSSRAVLVLVVTILFHKSGLWSCPIRSIFVPTFFFEAICDMFFLESIFRSSDVYGADDFRGFSVCGRDDRTLCTSRRVDSLIAWSARFESVQGVFGASWMFFFSGEKG